MYTGDYDKVRTNNPDCADLLYDFHLHTFADKYDIPALMNLANARFLSSAGEKSTYPVFANIVRELYHNAAETKTEMRQCVIKICAEQVDPLFSVGKIASVWPDNKYSDLQQVARDVPKFASDVLFELASKSGVLGEEGEKSNATEEDTCPDCGCRPLDYEPLDHYGLEFKVYCPDCGYEA